jgi:hypothetical protein
LKNDKGEELEITLNELNMRQIEQMILEFQGNVAEINSVD